jgi:hypothetical protein
MPHFLASRALPFAARFSPHAQKWRPPFSGKVAFHLDAGIRLGYEGGAHAGMRKGCKARILSADVLIRQAGAMA